MKKRLFALLLVVCLLAVSLPLCVGAADEERLLNLSATWRYLDNGTDPSASSGSSDVYFELSELKLYRYVPEQRTVSLTVGADETERNVTWHSNIKGTASLQFAEKTTAGKTYSRREPNSHRSKI